MPSNDREEDLPEITLEEIAAIRARALVRQATAANDDGRVHIPAEDTDTKVQLNVRVPARLKNRVIAHARATGTDISGVVAAAVDIYLAWRKV